MGQPGEQHWIGVGPYPDLRGQPEVGMTHRGERQICALDPGSPGKVGLHAFTDFGWQAPVSHTREEFVVFLERRHEAGGRLARLGQGATHPASRRPSWMPPTAASR